MRAKHRGGRVSMSAGEVAIRAGNTVAWYDYTETSTLTYDGSNRISKWADKLGSGNDLTQTTDTRKPTITVNGVKFSGGASPNNQFMLTAAIASLDQPTMIYIVMKHITWTNGDSIIDGLSTNTGRLMQYTSTPNIAAYAGGSVVLDGNLTLDTFAVIRVLFNGASSKLIVNANTPTTGNFGTNNMLGIIMGAYDTNGGGAIDAEVKEAVFRNVADNSTDEANIYAYLKAKYSL